MPTCERLKDLRSGFEDTRAIEKMKGREHVPVGGVDPNRSTIPLNNRSGCAPLCTQSEDGIDGEGRAVMILESKTNILGVCILRNRCSNRTTPEGVPCR